MILTVTMNASVDKLYEVDTYAPGTVTRVKRVNNTAGGKGLNLSRVAAIAGEEVVATGLIGGYAGEYFVSLLPRENFTARFTKVDRELRNCVNIMDMSTGTSTEFLEPGMEVDEGDLERFLGDYTDALDIADVVTISGSCVVGAHDDFYARLVHIAKDAGKKVILDASGVQLKNGVKALPTMVKPNTDEITELLGISSPNREEVIEAAVNLHKRGIEIAAVSMGSEGVIVACCEGVYSGVPPVVKAVNTVGCGDSMIAGFAIGMVRGYTIEHTINYALAIATANALTMCTGSFKTEDLEALLGQARVEKIRD